MGYLKVASDSGKPIVPVGIKGAERTSVIITNVKPLIHPAVCTLDFLLRTRYTKKWKNLSTDAKTIPLPIAFLPAKVTAYVGKPIYPDHHLGNNPSKEAYSVLNRLVMNEIGKLSGY